MFPFVCPISFSIILLRTLRTISASVVVSLSGACLKGEPPRIDISLFSSMGLGILSEPILFGALKESILCTTLAVAAAVGGNDLEQVYFNR